MTMINLEAETSATNKLFSNYDKKINNQKEYNYFDRLHWQKYRDTEQTKDQHSKELSINLGTDATHAEQIYNILYYNRFLPAGRVQAALGAREREVSPFNCSVSQRINDSMYDIMESVSKAASILRLGTGIGYNFSNLRPYGAEIKKLKTQSSGPVSFMKIFDVMASTIASSGHRRGAQMGILNVNHPDIEAFIDAKLTSGAFRQFNLSVGISDKFMEAVKDNDQWALTFEGKVHNTISARYLWNKIIKNAYDSAEPGVLFLDTMNKQNNLFYCEEIEATNPCSEQPLPPHGLCTLGSFNLVAYLYKDERNLWCFNTDQFRLDIVTMVEAYDNIFDDAVYAIPEHKEEAINKRRIGLGLTGIANALELLVGEASYGEDTFNEYLHTVCRTLAITAYRASVELAKTRGPFRLFDPVNYPNSKFIQSLPVELQKDIEKHGIRNSHLISYAPCGTISQCAGNISSGVEPVFYHEISRDVHMKEGKEEITLKDFAWREFNFKGKTLEECTVEQHLKVAEICQKYCDSAVSKTINVASNCPYEEYEQIYQKAYELGLKGITVYRPTELRGSVIKPANTSELNTASCASGSCER